MLNTKYQRILIEINLPNKYDLLLSFVNMVNACCDAKGKSQFRFMKGEGCSDLHRPWKRRGKYIYLCSTPTTKQLTLPYNEKKTLCYLVVAEMNKY